METAKIRDAFGTIKKVAAQFAAFAVVDAACDDLLALVNHEDELRARIEAAKGDLHAVQQTATDVQKAAKKNLADIATEHNGYIAEYATHRDQLRAEATAVETECRERVESARAAAIKQIADSDTALQATLAATTVERAKIEADHAAFITQTKEHRATIEANTVLLQTQLDTLREKVAAVLA